MAVYLVTWDLNKEKPNYAQARNAFIAHIGRYEHIKDAGLDSVWFISANWTADQIDADLRTRLDNNDRLIVTLLQGGGHQGWLSQGTWDWINSHL